MSTAEVQELDAMRAKWARIESVLVRTVKLLREKHELPDEAGRMACQSRAYKACHEELGRWLEQRRTEPKCVR